MQGRPLHRVSISTFDSDCQYSGRTPLPSYRGDFDHFAVDLKGQRLFLAGEDQGTLEVFDLRDGRHLRSVTGFDAPHAIHFMPDRQRFLALVPERTGPGSITIVQNWRAALNTP